MDVMAWRAVALQQYRCVSQGLRFVAATIVWVASA